MWILLLIIVQTSVIQPNQTVQKFFFYNEEECLHATTFLTQSAQTQHNNVSARCFKDAAPEVN